MVRDMDKQNIKLKLGKSIAKARIAQGMTQEAVAAKLEIGNEAMSRIERGIVEPSITRIFELAEILNCDVQTLLGEATPNLNDKVLELSQKMAQLNTQEQGFVHLQSLQLIEQLQRYK